MVTIFKDILSTSTGFHRPVSTIFERIKKGKSKNIVLQIRNETDDYKRNEIKRKLPAICFSGTFNRRADNAMIQHSGLICLDFDKFPDEETLIKEKERLQKDAYTYALFLSPSGNGLKVIVKIPAKFEEHRDYFKALEDYYDSTYFDKSCINESRVCYESYDPDIYINPKSKVFEQKQENQQYDVGKDRAILPVKSENQIIQNLQKWFDKNYSMIPGNRNANLFKLAAAFNEFGVSKMEAEKELLKYQDATFTGREIENIVNSAYRNTASHATKFFEDEHTKTKIKDRIKAGDDIKRIQQAFPTLKPKEIEQVIEDIKADLSVIEFWDYDKNNKVILSHHKYKQFLEQNGYFKMYPAGSDNYIFILVRENLINNTTSTHIKDFVLNYLYTQSEMKPYDYMANQVKFFKDDYLNFIETAKIHLKEDTKDTCYLYFKNNVVEVSAKKIRTIDYLELDGYVWEKHIINRDYKKVDTDNCVFEKFINCVVDGNEKRFLSIITVIGYLLHSFKTNSNNKAIIFNDETISESPNGGSGKGIICNAIGQMKRVSTIDGKQFDFGRSFPYQTVSADTQVLVFDDVKKNFQFENLFSLVTEGITLEKKNKDAIKLPVNKSPKIVITTNYTIGGNGGSFERRKFEIELSSHFNENHTPLDEFGHMLFDDWNEIEWAKFDNFMIYCVQAYLQKGLIEYEYHNLETRKFINNTSFDFYEWIEDEKLILNENINVTDYYDRFISDFEDYKKFCSRKRFGKWMDLYAKHKGYTIKKGKANGVRYTIYSSASQDVENNNENAF